MSIKQHPLDDPTQQQIIKELEARVEEKRVKLIAALQQPRPTLDLQPGPCDVQLQIAPIFCWRCRALVKAVRGYITHQAFVALAGVSDTGTLAAFIVELRQRDPKLSPVSNRYSKTVEGRYFAAECPECHALFGDFFMTIEFFTEQTTCEFPSCGCEIPELQCRKFEYHGLTLNLGCAEIQTICDQAGSP
jgi:hypothetical protein